MRCWVLGEAESNCEKQSPAVALGGGKHAYYEQHD